MILREFTHLKNKNALIKEGNANRTTDTQNTTNMLNYTRNEVISYIPSGISQIPQEYYTLFFGILFFRFFISGLLSVLFSPSSSKPEGRNSEPHNYNIKIDVHEERNIHVQMNEEQRDEVQMNEEQRGEVQMNEEEMNDERIYEGEENPYLIQCLSTISSICRARSVKELNDMKINGKKITDNHILPLCEMLSGVKINNSQYSQEVLKEYFLAIIRNDRMSEDKLLIEMKRIYSLRDINTLNEENKKKLVGILICSDLEFPRSQYKKKKEFILEKLYNCITCLD